MLCSAADRLAVVLLRGCLQIPCKFGAALAWKELSVGRGMRKPRACVVVLLLCTMLTFLVCSFSTEFPRGVGTRHLMGEDTGSHGNF